MNSLMLGIFDGLFQWMQDLLDCIPKFFYFTLTLIMNLIDLFQLFVRKIAGLDVMHYNVTGTEGAWEVIGGSGDGALSGDLVLRIIQENIIMEILLSLALLAVILLLVFTIFMVLRNEYVAENSEKASKGKIVMKSFKAVLMMVAVPAIGIFGIFMSSVLLRALDSATQPPMIMGEGDMSEVFEIGYNYDMFGITFSSTTQPFSGMVFRATAYKANRIRNDDSFAMAMTANSGKETVTFGTAFNPGAATTGNINSRDAAAQNLDNAYAYCFRIKPQYQISMNERVNKSNSEYLDKFNRWVLVFDTNDNVMKSMTKYNIGNVWFYYNLWEYDYVVAIVMIVVCFKIFFDLSIGLMRRIYDTIILFLISPLVIAISPVDNGESLKEWRKRFVGSVIAVYAPIVVMNLFFMIVPYVYNISFFGTVEGGYKASAFLDYLVQAMIIIVGLVSIRGLMAKIGDLLDAGDPVKAGGDVSKQTTGLVTSMILSPINMVAKVVRGTGSAIGATGKSAGESYQASKEKSDAAGRTGVKAGLRSFGATSFGAMKGLTGFAVGKVRDTVTDGPGSAKKFLFSRSNDFENVKGGTPYYDKEEAAKKENEKAQRKNQKK